MDSQTLLYSVLLLAVCFIASSRGQEDDGARYQCYDCTYFKGMAEMNPNCREPDSSAPIKEDCEICSTRVFRNATRTYIRRYCTRACEDGRQYGVQNQDLQNVMATEYCCKGNRCNVGSDASHHTPLLAALGMMVFISALLSLR